MSTMRYTRTMVIVSALCFIVASLTACNSRLGRDDAARQLQAKYGTERQYAYIQTGHNDAFSAPINYVRVRSGQWRTEAKETAALSDAGLVKVEVVATGVPMTSIFFHGLVDHIVVTPTEKGTPFLAGTFPPGNNGVCNNGCLRFVTATPQLTVQGVAEPAQGGGKLMSVVFYQISWTNTQVGDILKTRYGAYTRQATFVKYDDGWRLVQH
jgi:hypothetical protein